MSYVFAAPEMMVTAAADVEQISTGLVNGDAAGVLRATCVVSAAADELGASGGGGGVGGIPRQRRPHRHAPARGPGGHRWRPWSRRPNG